jgi:ABC-2 type transport system permease protein
MTAQGTVISTAPRTAARAPRAMNSWRLEWLRLIRTPRWIALLGVYVVFGLLGPVLAKYLPDIVEHVQSDMTIVVPPPQPKDGIVNYLNQVGQTGLIVVVAIAASALAFDARRGLSTFLRSRASSVWELVKPRVVVTAVAVVLAYTLGTLAAWYETALLLGPLPVGAVLAGLLCEGLYLVFAVAVVAAAASVARKIVGIVGIALTALILLSVAGTLGVLHDWLPSTLAGAPVELLTTTELIDYLPAMAVTVGAVVALIAVAVVGLRRREV